MIRIVLNTIFFILGSLSKEVVSWQFYSNLRVKFIVNNRIEFEKCCKICVVTYYILIIY